MTPEDKRREQIAQQIREARDEMETLENTDMGDFLVMVLLTISEALVARR